MNKISYFLNLCFYHFYLLTIMMNNVFDYFITNPLCRLNVIKRRLAKFGIDNPIEYFKQFHNNPQNGTAIWVSLIGFGGWLSTLLLVSIIIINKTMYKMFFFRSAIIFLTVCIIFWIVWFFIIKEKKYLLHFNYFKNQDKKVRLKNHLQAAFIFFLSLLYIILFFWLI